MTITKTTKAHGFSLLELSIVLVIIGLIAGGITVGADMVRAAELRSVMTDLNKFQTAVYTFKDKYMALPGDMKNATIFWGAAHATPATCQTTSSTGAATCDGDGDGLIDTSTGSQESYRFWQHLANAGLVEGTFTGVSGPGHASADAIPGTNVSASKINSAGYYSEYGALQSGSTYYFDGSFGGNILLFGSDGGIGSTTQGPALSPEEAWSVDTKLDDGKPGLGSIVTWKGGYSFLSSSVSCATTAVPSTSEYNLTATTKACPLWFKPGY